MEVKTRDQEIQASELRLKHMEQDMVEMSAQNENYRSQVMNLTTQVDIAETQMRALQNQESWIGTDLQVSFFDHSGNFKNQTFANFIWKHTF